MLLILLSVTGVQDGGGEAPGDPELEPAEPKQPKLSENDKMTKYKVDSAVQKKYDKLVLELLSMNFLPFNSPELRSLMSFLDNRLNLKNIAREVQDKVKEMIKEFCGDSVAITSDMWSSRVLESYISGTFHFIDKEFRLHRWTPICQKFEGRHTGDKITSRPSWTSSWRSCPLTQRCTRHVCLTMQQTCCWGSGLVI